MNKFFGIDLGTTYSCVSYIDESGKPVILKNAEGELTTASVVFFETENNIVVGEYAKESTLLYPDQVVSYVKSSMGVPDASWNIYGIERTPEEISSYILKKLVNDANSLLRAENKLKDEENIKDVVITCPAYFGIAEREATKKAGEIAGLNILGIINEPTAAAITYGITDAVEEQVVLVYDLGGGTFDVTLIDISPQQIKVICTGGDHTLGGKLWDERIIHYIAEEFARQTGSDEDILDDPLTYQELLLASERAKRMLTAREKAPIALNHKGDRIRVELTRDQFEASTADLIERTILLTRQIMEEAIKKGYDPTEISEILLVGGSARMPQVKSRVEKAFEAPIKIYDPDESVAKGAVLYAARQNFFNSLIERAAFFSGEDAKELREHFDSHKIDIEEIANKAAVFVEDTGVDIINVTSRSFGTIAYGKGKNESERCEVLYNLILKNTELPIKESREFFTIVPNQRTVSIKVLESLSTDRLSEPKEGTIIGETVLELPEGLPAGSPLEIEFKLNEAGLLELGAFEKVHLGEVTARFETVDGIPLNTVSAAKERLENAMII